MLKWLRINHLNHKTFANLRRIEKKKSKRKLENECWMTLSVLENADEHDADYFSSFDTVFVHTAKEDYGNNLFVLK